MLAHHSQHSCAAWMASIHSFLQLFIQYSCACTCVHVFAVSLGVVMVGKKARHVAGLGHKALRMSSLKFERDCCDA
jgi:hypothetical protein